MKKKQQNQKTGVGKLTSEEITSRGGEVETPDVQKMYEEGYRGKTKKIWNQDRGVMEIRDVPEDPYKGSKTTRKNEKWGDVEVEVNFDKPSYRKMEE